MCTFEKNQVLLKGSEGKKTAGPLCGTSIKCCTSWIHFLISLVFSFISISLIFFCGGVRFLEISLTESLNSYVAL